MAVSYRPPSAASGQPLAAANAYTDEQFSRRSVSAYLGMVRNGAGQTGDNANFSSGAFVADDLVAGGGSFRFAGWAGLTTDDHIYADPARPLRFSYHAKGLGGSGLLYSAVNAYDVDKKAIEAAHWMYQTGTLTTLTQPLRPGDTVVHVASTSGWHPVSAGDHLRGVTVWTYRNSRGYQYLPETYSRYASLMDGGYYTASTSTTVTLSRPWPHPEQPAGSPVGNGTTGGTYTYIGAVGAGLTDDWQTFEGRTTGLDSGAARRGNGLPPGTATVKPFWFIGGDGSALINMVQLSEVIQ